MLGRCGQPPGPGTTAFPRYRIIKKYLSDVGQETEVWVSDNPPFYSLQNTVLILFPKILPKFANLIASLLYKIYKNLVFGNNLLVSHSTMERPHSQFLKVSRPFFCGTKEPHEGKVQIRPRSVLGYCENFLVTFLCFFDKMRITIELH